MSQVEIIAKYIIGVTGCTGGGPACAAGEGLGDKGLPRHPEKVPERPGEEVGSGADQGGPPAGHGGQRQGDRGVSGRGERRGTHGSPPAHHGRRES